MNTLKEIYLKRSEKDIDKWQHYFEAYDKHLSRFLGGPINMLEIGVFRGGSLKMWQEYFGKGGTIYGMDIVEEAMIHNDENIRIIVGDQADKDFLRKFLDTIPELDIVIDDGGHTATQQINAFEMIYPKIDKDGVYIVEDTHTSYMKEFQDLGIDVTFMEYTKNLIDQLHDFWRNSRVSASETIEKFTFGSDFNDSSIEVSDFCRMTKSIHIYDSMVVFEKGDRKHPVREIMFR